ncbi:acetoacetate decarboxylase family protein [Halogranum rubrum]|uniref:Acetoacetate decarboxylase n=1 Tax=Halogranum salarium B-1 TaxID=1210908 RepID=J3EWG0_9EURY|nr:acetoacetate decarboxylase family protein [Halogranum salarium]EJN59182.1 hypothetical protein HSB1_26030 [Halogranum salarium B-1]
MTFPDHTATLSTGRRVALPFRCQASLAGALFAADWQSLRRAVPDDLTPVRFGARTGGVVVAGVSYSKAGDFDPYDELAVVVPVARRTVGGVPLLDGGLGGYVLALPVTTEESRRMGREIWGYPKTVADVEIRRDAAASTESSTQVKASDTWHVELREDGERALTLSVRGAKPHTRETTLDSYTRHEGRLWRTPVEILGPVGVGVGRGKVSLDVGTGRLASRITRLGVGRPLGRFAGRIHARVQAGSAVD